MEEIAKHNESGMMLFPTDHAKILVDNDYIMASLGVLSKRYRNAAIRLLEQSLGFQFPEKKPENEAERIQRELQEMALEDEAKKAELAQHIKEMEEIGYDMEAYKHPDAIGGATAEEIERVKKETLSADRISEQQAGNPHVMRACGDVDGRKPDCDRNCRLCYRKHCKYRQE